MITVAIILFLLTATGGAVLLSYVLRDKPTPKGLSMIHGMAAALGIVILLIYALTTDSHHKHLISLTIFIIAAMGGGVLIYRDITGKSLPKWFAVMHGLIGLTGIGFLLYHTLSGH